MEIVVCLFYILPVIIGLAIFYFDIFRGSTIKDFYEEITDYSTTLMPLWLLIFSPVFNILFIIIYIIIKLKEWFSTLCEKYIQNNTAYKKLYDDFKNTLNKFLNSRIK